MFWLFHKHILSGKTVRPGLLSKAKLCLKQAAFDSEICSCPLVYYIIQKAFITSACAGGKCSKACYKMVACALPITPFSMPCFAPLKNRIIFFKLWNTLRHYVRKVKQYRPNLQMKQSKNILSVVTSLLKLWMKEFRTGSTINILHPTGYQRK